MSEDTNITMTRGDTLSFGVEMEGLEQDLSGAFFTIKTSYSDSTAVVQKRLGNGISKVETGKYRVRLDPADTQSLECGRYYYDFEVRVNGDVFTFLRGVLTLEYDATR